MEVLASLRRNRLVPYLVLFALFVVNALTAGSKPAHVHRSTYAIASCLIIILVGLRFHVGGDWVTYEYLFREIGSKPLQSGASLAEPGYTLLNWCAFQLGLGVWAVNLVCATIFTVGLISVCRWQPNPSLALLVAIPYLVIVVAMGYTRQSVALGLVLLAITELHRGSMVRMLICLVTAVFFHKSAVIVFPIFALSASKQRFFPIIAIGGLSYFIYKVFVSGSLDHFINNYIDANYSSSGALVRVLMNVVPAAIFLPMRDRFQFDATQKRLWTLFSLASLLALVALAIIPSSTAVDRIALYLIPLQLVVLSRLPVVFTAAQGQSLSATALVIAYSAVVELIWLNFGAFSRLWIPYQNYIVVWLT